MENSAFPEEGSPGNGNIGELQVVAVEGKGEVKHGGEDGRSNSGAPHRERQGGENGDCPNVRRGRGVYSFLFSLTLYKRISKTGKFQMGETLELSTYKGDVKNYPYITYDHFSLCLVLSFDSTRHSSLVSEGTGWGVGNIPISPSFMQFSEVAKFMFCHPPSPEQLLTGSSSCVSAFICYCR